MIIRSQAGHYILVPVHPHSPGGATGLTLFIRSQCRL